MRTLYFLFALALILPSSTLAQEYPTVELSKEEFIKFEKEKGTKLTSPPSNFGVILSSSLYPYVDSYDLAQPIQGERILNSDSMILSLEAFYDKNSQKIKYVSYSLEPEALSFQQIFEQLQSEGDLTPEEMESEIVKRLNEQENNPAYQKKIIARYENLQEYFAKEGKLIENRKRSKDIVLTNIKTYKVNQATIELSLKGRDSLKTATNVDIYWE